MRSSFVLLALTLSLTPAAVQAAPARSKLLANGTGKTVLRKVILGNDITVAVISRAGTAMVCDPANMPPGLIPDFIAVTHDHHVNKAYLEEAKAVKTVVQEVGTWTVGDMRVTGIAAGHLEQPVNEGAPDMVVYLIEVDGLRIAYLSCLGQAQLEPSQLAALGKVDVALITDEPGNRTYSMKEAARARDLVKQLGARIVVPLSHHYADMELTNDIIAELAGGKLETVKGQLLLGGKGRPAAGPRVVHIQPHLAP